MPHFPASYRMVYRTRASIRAHPWAAIYVPILLVACCIAAIIASQWTPAPISALLTVSSSYLAWHYTGQAWGMIATFTHIAGTPFITLERRLVRGSLVILMAWHVTWFLHNGYRDFVDLSLVYQSISALAAVALVMGLTGFLLHRSRTGRFAPLRAWIPWIAIFVWYAFMAVVGLPALFVVQIAHAVQYLIFPFRGLGSRPGHFVGFAISAFFNIHHYFTDGVVWKLRNPEVRQDLFGHLITPAPVPVRTAVGRRPRGR